MSSVKIQIIFYCSIFGVENITIQLEFNND